MWTMMIAGSVKTGITAISANTLRHSPEAGIASGGIHTTVSNSL